MLLIMYQIFSSLLGHLPFSVQFFLHIYGVTFFETPNISHSQDHSSWNGYHLLSPILYWPSSINNTILTIFYHQYCADHLLAPIRCWPSSITNTVLTIFYEQYCTDQSRRRRKINSAPSGTPSAFLNASWMSRNFLPRRGKAVLCFFLRGGVKITEGEIFSSDDRLMFNDGELIVVEKKDTAQWFGCPADVIREASIGDDGVRLMAKERFMEGETRCWLKRQRLPAFIVNVRIMVTKIIHSARSLVSAPRFPPLPRLPRHEVGITATGRKLNDDVTKAKGRSQ